jgi:hypothetical protein
MQRSTTLRKNNLKLESTSLMSDETLRQELRRMRATKRASPNNNDPRKDHLLLIGFCLFALAGLFYRYWPSEQATQMATVVQPVLSTSPKNLAATSLHLAMVKPRPVPNEQLRQPKQAFTPQEPCITEAPSPRAYEPNVYLEQLVGSMSCIIVKTQAPVQDTVYTTQNCYVQIPFEGTVSGAQESLNLSVYSNQPENYKNDRPVFEEPLLLEKTGANQRYALKAMLTLPPGLYYFVIENKEEKTIAVGKFKVG